MTKLTTKNLPTHKNIWQDYEDNALQRFVSDNEPQSLKDSDKWRQQLCDALNYHAEKVAVGFAEWLVEDRNIGSIDYTKKLFSQYLEELKQK